jgi:hypothetical protein
MTEVSRVAAQTAEMYKLRWWTVTQELKSMVFDNLHDAIHFSIYNTPYQSFYGIDKVEK